MLDFANFRLTPRIFVTVHETPPIAHDVQPATQIRSTYQKYDLGEDLLLVLQCGNGVVHV